MLENSSAAPATGDVQRISKLSQSSSALSHCSLTKTTRSQSTNDPSLSCTLLPGPMATANAARRAVYGTPGGRPLSPTRLGSNSKDTLGILNNPVEAWSCAFVITISLTLGAEDSRSRAPFPPNSNTRWLEDELN